ncbi:HAMP domain-containing protein [Catenovulum sp. SM1970]|uniref:ATP-binding protein n=1 Tax=Marinifaba aquimaris TaxID=2741323 RepID=UPI001574BD8A|nr:ATP-binding protein [Marinifaba aquimaris]NTS78524.1 HAMP domain-containing protein [Marinifaba aquimaris]
MNAFFSIGTFNRKLLIMVMATSLLSLTLVATALTIINIKNYKTNMQTSLQEKARLLSYNLVPMLVFDDNSSASEAMSAFSTNPNILSAQVFQTDSQGSISLFAEYQRRDYPSPSTKDISSYLNPQFSERALILSQIISFEGEKIGYLHIHRELSELDEFLQQSIAISTIVLIFSLIIAMMMSVRFQFILLKPLQYLIDVTQKVRDEKNYDVRARTDSNDEFAVLAESFNHMLQEIAEHHHKQLAVESEVRQLNLVLEDKVHARTLELEKSNGELVKALDSLQDSQKQLVEKETMASLGQLVAGIAHEVNTPVGIGVTAISHLAELHKKLEKAYLEKTLSAKDMKQYLQTSSEAIDVMDKSLHKAAELVSSFKQVAVDQSSDNIRPVKLDDYLQEILTTLKPKLKRVSHQLKIDCCPDTVNCNAGAIYQIITNLIMNSILHGFDTNVSGIISIKIYLMQDHVHIDYSDNGKGLSPDNLASLFEPFFTTKRGEGGTGLGTHIIYNLVTQALNGDIAAKSKIGQGLSYQIHFPVVNQ